MVEYGHTKWTCHACNKECSDADDIRSCRSCGEPIHKECDKDGSWFVAHCNHDDRGLALDGSTLECKECGLVFKES